MLVCLFAPIVYRSLTQCDVQERDFNKRQKTTVIFVSMLCICEYVIKY